MSDSLPLVRVLVSKYRVLHQKSNCDNFDDAEEVDVLILVGTMCIGNLLNNLLERCAMENLLMNLLGQCALDISLFWCILKHIRCCPVHVDLSSGNKNITVILQEIWSVNALMQLSAVVE